MQWMYWVFTGPSQSLYKPMNLVANIKMSTKLTISLSACRRRLRCPSNGQQQSLASRSAVLALSRPISCGHVAIPSRMDKYLYTRYSLTLLCPALNIVRHSFYICSAIRYYSHPGHSFQGFSRTNLSLRWAQSRCKNRLSRSFLFTQPQIVKSLSNIPQKYLTPYMEQCID